MATDDYQAQGQMNTQDLGRGLGKQGIQTGQVPREGEVPFTQEGLQNYLGPRFQVKPSRQGNFQINIANMRASSDDDKLTLLYKARNMLRAVGFEASTKFTFRSQITNRFENWPCLWVDRGGSEQTSNLGRIANRLEKLLARIEEVGGELPLDTLQELGGGDTFEEDREIEPSEEDMEHAAMIQRNKHQVARGQGVRRNQDPMTRTPTLNQPSPGYPGDARQHGGKVRPGRSPAPTGEGQRYRETKEPWDEE